jgi:hypothetical protein
VTPVVSYQPIPILIDSHDTQGLLALLDGQLVAVLSRLDAEAYGRDLKGRWHLEAGFGPCDGDGHLFATPEDIPTWVRQCLNSFVLFGQEADHGRSRAEGC